MDLKTWVEMRDGIVHRADAAERGFSPARVRAAIRAGDVQRIRATWIATGAAPADLRSAAENRHSDVATLHWASPLAAPNPRTLTASVEDALSHVANCLEFEDALTVWESAIRMESLDIESLRNVRWRDERSRMLARRSTGRSDSGIETLFVIRMRGRGIPIRQQVRLAGHDVDAVIGSHLVIQIDGFAHHSSAAQRTRDLAHDAELRMRGYTVLRFTYAQIMHEWDAVERTVMAALARGLHLAPELRGVSA